jgi:hypothetical protein
MATENGQIMYPLGVNTVLNGILPQPGGTQFFNYMQYYTADSLNDSDGNNIDDDFKLNIFVEVVRVMHTWTPTVGPFTIASGVVVPMVNVDMELFGSSSNKFDIGDITLEPLNIGYSNSTQTFFSYLAFDVAIPTGSYSKDDLANTGVNYYSFQPVFNITWFPTSEWEVTASAAFQINTENNDTNYQSGSLAMLEYDFGYMVTDKLQLGAQGFFASQFTEDELDGVEFNNGNKLRTNAIGPQLKYDFMPRGGLVLKWQHEYGVENRSEGDKIWFQFTFQL